MARPRKAGWSGLLTETELEMMSIVWRIGRATVADVLQALPPERALAYTSVSSMLRILEQKGALTAEKAGRGHVYAPAVTRDDYASRSVRHLVSTVFDGAAPSLVRCLVEQGELSEADVASLRHLLDRKEPS
jgi:predicted transcriptional regulator